jgi:diaminohydroxyphosphoribosylaminopyrimidine deaminase/5-amino-6-(5-phosphoribosylamino)uracil reductase
MLQAWIDEGYWDEARVITNNELRLPGGLPAPELKDARPGGTETLLDDTVRYYRRFE